MDPLEFDLEYDEELEKDRELDRMVDRLDESSSLSFDFERKCLDGLV